MSRFFNDFLVHHGIQGQKWGVRRYQNPDGSLTAEGRERYGSTENAYKSRAAETYGKHAQASRTHQKALSEYESKFLDKMDEAWAKGIDDDFSYALNWQDNTAEGQATVKRLEDAYAEVKKYEKEFDDLVNEIMSNGYELTFDTDSAELGVRKKKKGLW